MEFFPELSHNVERSFLLFLNQLEIQYRLDRWSKHYIYSNVIYCSRLHNPNQPAYTKELVNIFFYIQNQYLGWIETMIYLLAKNKYFQMINCCTIKIYENIIFGNYASKIITRLIYCVCRYQAVHGSIAIVAVFIYNVWSISKKFDR